MSLLRDESTAVTKPDGSKTFLYGRLRFPFRACEPGYLDRHPLPIPPPCPEGELLPKRKIFMRDTRDGELLPKRKIFMRDTRDGELLPKRKIFMRDTRDGPEGGCRICSLDEHYSTLFPYNKSHIRKNAIVGRGCDVVCKVCHALFSVRCCNQDLGCARLKFSYCCLKYDEHWSEGCPCMISYNAGTFIITSSEYLKGKSVG